MTAKGRVEVCACGEAITRSFATRGLWLHTDGRDYCVNQLTREPTGGTAGPRPEPARLDPEILAANLRRAGVRQ